MRAFNKSSGRMLARKLRVAQTLAARAKGLLGEKELPEGEGLLIRPCLGVHTFLMRFPIDVVFLDGTNRVLATVSDLKPHRMTGLLVKSSSALELPAGAVAASRTRPGDQIVIDLPAGDAELWRPRDG